MEQICLDQVTTVIQSLNAARAQRRTTTLNQGTRQAPHIAFASIIDADEMADEYNCNDKMEPHSMQIALYHTDILLEYAWDILKNPPVSHFF